MMASPGRPAACSRWRSLCSCSARQAVTHELLHLLGLEDDGESLHGDSDLPVIFDKLTAGITRRELTRLDTSQLAVLFREGRPTSRSGALAAVPEPTTLVLLGLGTLALMQRRPPL